MASCGDSEKQRALRLTISYLEEARNQFTNVARTIEQSLKVKGLFLEEADINEMIVCVASLENTLEAMSLKLTKELMKSKKSEDC